MLPLCTKTSKVVFVSNILFKIPNKLQGRYIIKIRFSYEYRVQQDTDLFFLLHTSLKADTLTLPHEVPKELGSHQAHYSTILKMWLS